MKSLGTQFDEAIRHHQAGRLAEAMGGYKAVLSSQPSNPAALHFLGLCHHQQGRHAEALPLMLKAVQLAPRDPTFHSNLGPVYFCLGQLDKAAECYERALRLDPATPGALSNLGNIHESQGRLPEAIECYRRAIALNPKLPDAHVNLGVALQKLNLVDDAIAAYHSAVTLSPMLVQAHWNLSQALLLKGDLAEGWREFEWRLLRDDFARLRSSLPRPHELKKDNAVCLVQSEQGYGDLFQFARFIPSYRGLLPAGARLVLRCPAQTRRLLAGLPGVDELEAGDAPSTANYDASIPLLSLPLALGIDTGAIATPGPYLKADGRLAGAWRERLPNDAFNVGLCWAGSPTHKNDHNRSIPPSKLAPLASIPGARLHSLHKGTNQLGSFPLPDGMEVYDLSPLLDDFADTAAAIAGLDLVITVDTSLAHLAGALGAKTWVLLPFAPDWRWGLSSETTPWYPSVRLFRQPSAGDWEAILSQITSALKELISARP